MQWLAIADFRVGNLGGIYVPDVRVIHHHHMFKNLIVGSDPRRTEEVNLRCVRYL
jgi:hypothetical protein